MKKGFTLVELLAVILILGIIAGITTVIVSDIIIKGENKALIESAENYIEAVELAIKNKNINEEFNPRTCVVNEKGNLICDGVSVKVEISKNIPIGGIIKLENGVMESVSDLKINGNTLNTNSNKEFVIK